MRDVLKIMMIALAAAWPALSQEPAPERAKDIVPRIVVPPIAVPRDLPEIVSVPGVSMFTLRGPDGIGPMLFAFQKPARERTEEGDRYYERGQRDLEKNRWEQAVENFNEAASRGGSRADGSLYWKAYAQNKMGRREDALATLAELRKTFPGSRWLDDAGALDVEVRQASGKPVSPESATDEEMKLMALNGLMNSDPDRALPLLEKLLHSSQSPKIKERALFVLTQSGSSNARKMVVEMAKGASNPDLQMKAVHYLGVMGAKQELGDVYTATSDNEVKRSILHALDRKSVV